MTYFSFLAIFLAIPIVALAILRWVDCRRGLQLPQALRTWPPDVAIFILVLIAVIYTTPWDNYLVATKVWWYDAELVTGIVLGYVPIEEYTFFIVQPIMTGLLWIALARRIPAPAAGSCRNSVMNWISAGLVATTGVVSLIVLLTGWTPATYAALELSWASLPIAIQLMFGADILWHYRKLVISTIALSTLYLASADSLAIRSGTWTIDPEQSFDLLLFGTLPCEEVLFFLLTNCLVTFGITLALAEQSQMRLPAALRHPTRVALAEPPEPSETV